MACPIRMLEVWESRGNQITQLYLENDHKNVTCNNLCQLLLQWSEDIRARMSFQWRLMKVYEWKLTERYRAVSVIFRRTFIGVSLSKLVRNFAGQTRGTGVCGTPRYQYTSKIFAMSAATHEQFSTTAPSSFTWLVYRNQNNFKSLNISITFSKIYLCIWCSTDYKNISWFLVRLS